MNESQLAILKSMSATERARYYLSSTLLDRDKSWGVRVLSGEHDTTSEMALVFKVMEFEARLFNLGNTKSIKDYQTIEAALHKARYTFEEYTRLHNLKGTNTGREKALANEKLARQMEEAIISFTEPKRTAVIPEKHAEAICQLAWEDGFEDAGEGKRLEDSEWKPGTLFFDYYRDGYHDFKQPDQ